MYSEISHNKRPIALPDLELLEAVRLRPGLKALNLGEGTSFRTVELAQRLGKSSVVYGFFKDPKSCHTISGECAKLGLDNIELFQGEVTRLPFADGYFDRILLRPGYNEMHHLKNVLGEAARVTKSSGQLIMSVPLQDALKEYYSVMEDALKKNRLFKEAEAFLLVKRTRKKSLKDVEIELRCAGLNIEEISLRQYNMSFLDGTAFLNHQMARNELIPDWKYFINGTGPETIFSLVEEQFNKVSRSHASLIINMPFAVLNCAAPLK